MKPQCPRAERSPGTMRRRRSRMPSPFISARTRAEEVVAKYRTIYPDKSPIEIVIAAATAFRAWPGQVMEAERRASNPKSQPHTWVYQMNWHRDAPGARAMHTIDIPFMFDNLSAAPGQVGLDARRTGGSATAGRRHVGHADSLRCNRQSQPSRSANVARIRSESAQHDDLGNHAAR